jgi:hypothetical protein
VRSAFRGKANNASSKIPLKYRSSCRGRKKNLGIFLNMLKKNGFYEFQVQKVNKIMQLL